MLQPRANHSHHLHRRKEHDQSPSHSLVLWLLSADDDLVAARIGHHVMQGVVIAVAHSDAAVRRGTQEDAVPPSDRTPTRPHCSVDVDSSAVEFFHVQLVWPESITTHDSLAPWSVRRVAVLRRDVIFFPDCRRECSRWSHVPVASDNYA